MSLLIRAILEFIRIFALLGIYSIIVNYVIVNVTKSLNTSLATGFDMMLRFLFLLIFLYWYRRKGQFSGWYPVSKDQ